MHNILATEIHNFNDGLKAINHACNEYLANQIPANSQIVEALARQQVSDYLISRDDSIKEVINNLNVALSKNRENDENSEADLVAEIRLAVDIIKAENLILTFGE